MIQIFLFRGEVFVVCAVWGLELFEGRCEGLSVHIPRRFCFGVYNPNSILIFNSYKQTARFVHCIEKKTQLQEEVVYTGSLKSEKKP